MRDQVENSVEIRRPVNDVFPYVVTPAHWPQWAGPVIAVDTGTQSGRLHPDEEFTVVSKLMGRQLDTKYRVIEFEENHILHYVCTTGPLPHEFIVRFEPVTNGTRVTQTVVADQDQAGGFFKLAYPLVEKIFARQSAADLQTLRDVLEAQSHS
ncbi:MAG: hypothetical protein K0Q93_1908 [Nocardioidaceae bacterium]|nr:hypothetical protein [Nocardioidaceae bacterium]